MSSHYDVPTWAGKPPIGLHLDVMKEDKFLQKLMIDEKRCYLFGRNGDLCDFAVEHQSCSRVHSALVYHKHLNRAFLVDLGSTHGTYIGSIRLESQKPTQLPVDSKFHFGASTRTYVIRERPQKPPEEEGLLVELPESELELDNLTEYNTAHNRRVTMLGISEEGAKKRTTTHRKRVGFRGEDDVINPEDIDPSVGRFRNLIQTQVIPSKRAKTDVGGGGVQRPVEAKYNFNIGGRDDSKEKITSALFSPLMSSKLGLHLPNPAPDIYADLDPPKNEMTSTVPPSVTQVPMESFQSPLDAPAKKKYPKEAWSGKKSAAALF